MERVGGFVSQLFVSAGPLFSEFGQSVCVCACVCMCVCVYLRRRAAVTLTWADLCVKIEAPSKWGSP